MFSPYKGRSVDIGELTIGADRLWLGEATWETPLVFIDLAASDDFPAQLVLPPCPVIGIGDPAHPFGSKLDAVVNLSWANVVARQVLARPRAAAVTVELLRLLPGLSTEAALATESLAYTVLQFSLEHAAWRATNRVTGQGEGRVTVTLDGGQLDIILDRPGAANAIDRAMRDQLREALSLAALDAEIKRVVLRANGKVFSLGADLSEFGTVSDPATAHAIRARTLPAWAAGRCADRLEVHIQGACVGAGLELAAWGHRITAERNAWFQLPELAMGILPGAGGCVSLCRRIGRQRTAFMILSGERVSAREALSWGLIDAIVDEPA